MSKISFRLTLTDVPEHLMSYMIQRGLTLLVKERGSETEKDHFHGYIEMNLKTFRDYLRVKIGGGNTVYSVKECFDVAGYLRYCCKGESKDIGPDIRYNVGHDIEKLHEEYWNVNAELKVKANKKRKAENVLEEVWEAIKGDLGHSVSGTQCAQLIVRWHLDNNRRLPAGFAMQTMCMTYVARSNDRLTGPDKLTDAELVARLYPNINF